MNNRAVRFIKNFSYTITSNFLTLLISTLIILIVPKLIGVEQYGYWQLYLFYSSYVGFLHFGWNDGIYLRYGGIDYDKLDKKTLQTQFYMLVIFQMLILIIGFFLLGQFNLDPNKVFILKMTLICMVLVNVSIMLQYILQCTNRIKEYASLTVFDRLVYSSLLIIFLLFRLNNFKVMIYADLIGKLVSLIMGMYFCREIVFYSGSKISFQFKETFKNISIGIKLMLANIASMLIVGIVRLGIETYWSVETFGKISLTLSISNLMMVFINAIGLIMFPILRKIEMSKLPFIYKTLGDILMVIMFAALIIYYPLKAVLLGWLPEYADGLSYMALLFPISVYEGKMSLLVNTYLKTMREEKAMLKINGFILFLSVILTVGSTIYFNSLNLAVLSITVLLAIRCVLAEIYLSKILNINVMKDIFFEIGLTIFFIFNTWMINSWIGLLNYFIAYMFYIFIKKKEILKAKDDVTSLLKN